MSLYDLVSGQLTTCQDYASDAIDQANDYLATLADSVLEPVELVDSIEYEWPEPDVEVDYILRPQRPDGLEVTERDIPLEATVNDIEVPSFPEIPSSSAEEPTPLWPLAPNTDLPDAPTNAPTIDEVTIPGQPDITIPDIPLFDDIVVPGDPEVSFPTFDEDLPVADLVPPENGFIYNEAIYESDLADALRAKILGLLDTGGTGLGASVEAAIWNQAKLRTESENARLYDEALNFWAARGWSIPTGALDGRLYEVSVEQSRALADVNEKILIEQARLAQEMDKFIIQSSLQFEQQVMNYSNEVQNRAFQAAKAVVELGIATFQAKVLWYNAQVDAYKSIAQVYEIRIRAELGKVEVFKAQLEAASIKTQIRKSELDIYLAQLQVATTLIDLYKSQMQAAALHVEINKSKLELFRLQVETYQVQVQSKVAEYDLYKSQLAGEQMKIQVYSEIVKAYAIKVEGLKVQVDTKRAEVEVQALINKNNLDVMLANVERYKTVLMGDVEKVRTVAAVYDTEGRLYSSDIQYAGLDIQAQIEVYRGNLSRAKNQTDILLKEADMNLQAFIHNRTLAIEAAKAGANVCAQLAASAMSAVHAGASIGFSGSESSAVQESKSTATSEQTVYQHVYNES